VLTLIEALNYRSLRHVRQPLGRFHVLVGASASGKTTFLDVPAFLARLVSDGLEAAVHERAPSFLDLVWQRAGRSLELAIEARIPEDRRHRLGDRTFETVRYEVAVGVHPHSDETCILAERVLLKSASPEMRQEPSLFPAASRAPETILSSKGLRGEKTVVRKVVDGNDNFHDETGKGWDHTFRLGPRKSALGHLPEDESKFPVATWLKSFLVLATQKIALQGPVLRRASPPGPGKTFQPDGSNLPWVVAELEKSAPGRIADWIAFLRPALPEIEGLRTVEREDDRHRYLLVRQSGGFEVPSWMVSDGALRLIALTLPAFLPGIRGTWLIEEPENGIDPRGIETLYRALLSAREAQVLLATHSPVLLSIVDPAQVLCLAKTPEGATDILSGNGHPGLSQWRGEANLGHLFAAGVFG
jgi:predicted ATPase